MDGRARSDELLRGSFASVEVHAAFTEAQLVLTDKSRLCCCHRVGERWAKAVDASLQENAATLAGQLLSQISMFRLNAKHLEIWFDDGSTWERSFRAQNSP